jgi:hypothetical protein
MHQCCHREGSQLTWRCRRFRTKGSTRMSAQIQTSNKPGTGTANNMTYRRNQGSNICHISACQRASIHFHAEQTHHESDHSCETNHVLHLFLNWTDEQNLRVTHKKLFSQTDTNRKEITWVCYNTNPNAFSEVNQRTNKLCIFDSSNDDNEQTFK